MKKELGISVYPTVETIEESLEYLTLAKKYGFSKVFLSLLQIDLNDENQLKLIEDFIEQANKNSFTISMDITKDQMKKLKISIIDLSYFKKIGVGIIRLDDAFSGLEEAIMSNNPYGIKIELNITTGKEYLKTVLSNSPNKENIIGTHNFYPHRYTGLDFTYFMETSSAYKEEGIRTGAFINSNEAEIGPWPIQEGICTLESHRNLPVGLQVKDLRSTNVVDDIIIGNAFASEEELASIAEVFFSNQIPLSLISDSKLSEEENIILNSPHVVRRGYSSMVLRSAASRMYAKELDLPPSKKEISEIKRGDVVIDNNLYLNYKGELQICLANYPANGKQNVIGKIPAEEMFIVDRIAKEPWKGFSFVQKNNCLKSSITKN